MKHRRWKNRLYEIVFEADTRSGKLFDILLILFILISIFNVMVESVPGLSSELRRVLTISDWIITFLFLAEYIVRITVVNTPRKYIFSFFGIVDLVAILPFFIGLVISGTHMLIVFRSLRLLRIFRIMKYGQLENEARQMGKALRYSKNKIGVFLFTLLILVVILGTVMYLIESPFNGGFSSIPISIYWAVVTLTTVGYGDIAPITTFGQTLAGFIMILGYSIIAVPTGIVTAEFSRVKRESELTSQVCPACLKEGHEEDALFCKFCGSEINPEEADTN